MLYRFIEMVTMSLLCFLCWYFFFLLDGGLLQDAAFTLCLDTIGSGDELYLHVSKPPKEGSPGWMFLQVIFIQFMFFVYFMK